MAICVEVICRSGSSRRPQDDRLDDRQHPVDGDDPDQPSAHEISGCAGPAEIGSGRIVHNEAADDEEDVDSERAEDRADAECPAGLRADADRCVHQMREENDQGAHSAQVLDIT